jgi:hypothetical protein
MEPSTVKKEKKRLLVKCALTFRRRWEEFEIAHLATSDGIGIELFSFPHGVKKLLNSTFQYGSFSFLYPRSKYRRPIAKIVSTAANKECLFENIIQKINLLKCYVEDPFGIVFEIYTHSYELTYSSGAYTK